MQHLLGIDEIDAGAITAILDKAQDYADKLKQGEWDQTRLKGKIILHLFFEHSTRTLTSFEMAAKRLGADVINWNPETSSLTKGENFIDTIDTLTSMKPDAIVMRHAEFGAPKFVATRAKCPVINGGDSWREHPTQALLDALTMRQNFGKLEGLNVTIIGDIAHSRVASSNMQLLTKMGAHVSVVAPEILMPESLPFPQIKAYHTLEEGLPGADVVMTLRLQKERMDKALISDAAYFNEFGLTFERLEKFCPKAVIMDPGPLVRGVQMEDSVAEDPERSLILRQVANGIPTRMAVLDMLVGG
ncbi:MAG: aspartate carbamoyltransferase catalytic subunit [Alphaproteobacteria bacterium]|nr:aspartate carbamoyltransferase catalytic subunit [Alphaproteobacteria bacterium]